jgi:hypothetical protein
MFHAMNFSKLLTEVVSEAMNGFLKKTALDASHTFEYYRHGPISYEKLKPGFIFQQCMDEEFAKLGVLSVECGLGDHCLPDLGVGIQLKTSVSKAKADTFIFCRSSVSPKKGEDVKTVRALDVENRIFDMYGMTDTHKFMLVYVDLECRKFKTYLLHDGIRTVGDWLRPENVSTKVDQSHFRTKLSKMALCP